MKEFIEKLIGRLEEVGKLEISMHGGRCNGKTLALGYAKGIENSIAIVNQLAEEFNNGWIPCSERLPEKLEPVNITWVNRNPEPYYAHIKDIPFVATAFYWNEKWWWYSCVCEDYLSEYGKSECDTVDKDIDIIAWQPLPQPYQPKGE